MANKMTTKHTEICPKTIIILQNDNENNIMRFCQKIIIIKCLEISYEEKKDLIYSITNYVRFFHLLKTKLI